RFANALDALSVIGLYAPALNEKVGDMTKKINAVRGAKNERDKDFVDISRYGSERALNAMNKVRNASVDKNMGKNNPSINSLKK
ncbi:MAG: hypothetical protein IKH92_00920, partial [Clostridiales bacterium]|nr:hypothetical protein [Clostridiales bacterium]